MRVSLLLVYVAVHDILIYVYVFNFDVT